MKSFAVVLFVAQAVLLKNAYAQCIRSFGPNIINPFAAAGPIVTPAPFIAPSPCGNHIYSAPNVLAAPNVISSPNVLAAQNVFGAPSVANNLADTLSLLTVSSLLAETLPAIGYPGVVGLPAVAPTYPVGGCGCGYGNYYF